MGSCCGKGECVNYMRELAKKEINRILDNEY